MYETKYLPKKIVQQHEAQPVNVWIFALYKGLKTSNGLLRMMK
jgi:hypothetical protein